MTTTTTKLSAVQADDKKSEESRPPWLKVAHQNSVVRWTPKLLDIGHEEDGTLKVGVWRVDEHPGGYQRPLKKSRVAEIMGDFDSAMARELYVSRRVSPEGEITYWLLDGQHTMEALIRLGFAQWPCRVFKDLSPAQEAEWFDILNCNTQKIPSVVDHNAKVLSGREMAVKIENTLQAYYLQIGSARIRNKEGYISFSSANMFEQIVKMGGEALLSETIQLCVDAWGHKKSSFMGRVMIGIAYLLAWNEVPLNRSRMVAVLNNTTQAAIVESLGSTGTGGGPSKCARAIIELYLVGVPADGYPKIRANGSDAPKLPDRKISRGEGSPVQSYWTEETANVGRREIGPFVAPAKPTPPPKKSKAEQVAAQVDELMGDVTASTVDTAPAEAPEIAQEDLTEVEGVTVPEGDVDASAEAVTDPTDDDLDGWEFPAPEGTAPSEG